VSGDPVVREAVDIPVLVGSGVTADNVDLYLQAADAAIVGSHFKQDGRWDRPVDPARVQAFMERARQARNP